MSSAVLTKVEFKKRGAMFSRTGNLVIDTIYDDDLHTEQAEIVLGGTIIYLTAEQRDEFCHVLMNLNLNLVAVYKD